MSLKFNEANPLSVFQLRRMDHCPPHFTKIEFDLRTSEKAITDWIWENLAGRFYIGDQYYETDGGSIVFRKMVGFEIPSEASYFGLISNTINTFGSEIF